MLDIRKNISFSCVSWIWAIAWGSSSFAITFDPESVTVKVHSGYCRDGELDFQGTGILFSHQNQLYAVTSEHVLIHDDGDFCHNVSNDNINFQGYLVQKDWGRGLALLAIDEALPIFPIPSLADFDDSEVSRDTKVTTAGYPHSVETLRLHTGGSVLETASSRHFLAAGGAAIEIVHSHGEFGMSGGGVYSIGHDRIYGLLSHQYIATLPGRPSRVGSYGGETLVQNHLLALPASTIKNWLNDFFSGGQKSLFVRDSLRQANHQDAVYSSGYEFLTVKSNRSCADSLSNTVGGGQSGRDWWR